MRKSYMINCHDKISKKRTQSTLAKFNFTQHVKHKGKRVKVDIPPYATSCDADLIKCLHCDMKFKNQQGLSVMQTREVINLIFYRILYF